MKKILIIARHEYLVNVRRPGFIGVTLLVPLLGLLALIVGSFFSGQATDFVEQIFVGSSQPTGVVDRSGLFTPILPDYAGEFALVEDVEEGRAAVAEESIQRLIVVPADYLQTGRVDIITGESSFSTMEMDDSGRLRRFFTAHLLAENVEPILQERVLRPYSPTIVNLDGEVQSDGGGLSEALGFLVPYLLSVFLIVTIFVSSGYLLRSVSEEKTNRVIEILLSSVTARELLAGKVLGLGALGLTQVLVWIGSSIGLSGGAVGLLGVAIPLLSRPEVFLLAVVYYVLGFLIYAVLMGSVGALGADMQESQQLAGIFSLTAAVPLMVVGLVFANPNGSIVRAISWFPLTAPTMMMLRLPMAEVPVIDIFISIGSILLAIPFILWLGAKIFRLGLLMYGKRPGVREIFRLLREA